MGKKKKHCHDSICQYLSHYMSSEVTLTLESGQIVSGELVKIKENGLIVLQETNIISPFIEDLTTIVRCRDVVIATIQTEP
ncbi:hypothetical protein M670_02432 [Schinkia azotoformans MEV2011]|uniref:LSM domain-containing protein n=2 Tax=Schinkia azotoformans TaxID=1454 RepID=K6CT51_SCHAZ|nr:hypothetical protein [Schinkia azotoformans]EKN63432.1 hypothetical protein BAZO_17209 [Schinkia azotoformans LMG 9581]KEF38389.1 hypothetical protein M670_02432 [Schinkia azotoformans MEV2011]MEC1638731.1 hypothetical protein [Schinkia azotoformans]MEC1694132.1 hypothetical protein [Schinkia azotoformans]MEC1715844.1 hypothetical protein [Schinkia azotoformans]